MKRFFVLATLVLAACGSGSRQSQWTNLEIQNVSTGDVMTVKDVLQGQPTFITLWSVTCQPCRREMPWLEKIAKEHEEIDVVGIDIGDDINDIKTFTSEIGVTFPMYRDELGDVLSALEVSQVPVTFAVNAQGDITWKNLGAMTFEDLEAQLQKMGPA